MKTSPFSEPGSDWKQELRRFLQQLRTQQDWMEYHLHELANAQEELRAEARMVELFLDLLGGDSPSQ